MAHNAHVKKLLLTHFNPKYDRASLLEEARVHFENTELSEIGRDYYL